MPKLGTTVESWTIGIWTSQLCDVSLQGFPTSTDNQWGNVTWEEENTDDETQAYVRVDLLDSSSNNLQTDLVGTGSNLKKLNLNNYSNAKNVDIYLKFKLYSLSKRPIVKNIKLRTNKEW